MSRHRSKKEIEIEMDIEIEEEEERRYLEENSRAMRDVQRRVSLQKITS